MSSSPTTDSLAYDACRPSVDAAARTLQEHLRRGRVAGVVGASLMLAVQEHDHRPLDGPLANATGSFDGDADGRRRQAVTPRRSGAPAGRINVVHGVFLLTAYDAATGKKLAGGGLSLNCRPHRRLHDRRNLRFAGKEPGNEVTVPAAAEVWKTADLDGNGLLSRAEFPEFTPGLPVRRPASRPQRHADARRWRLPGRGRLGERHAAIRPGGSGDMSVTVDSVALSTERAAAPVAPLV